MSYESSTTVHLNSVWLERGTKGGGGAPHTAWVVDGVSPGPDTPDAPSDTLRISLYELGEAPRKERTVDMMGFLLTFRPAPSHYAIVMEEPDVLARTEWTENNPEAVAGSAGRPIWKVSGSTRTHVPIPDPMPKGGIKGDIYSVTLVADGMEPRTVKVGAFLANYTPAK